jgi:hypothetical protein
MVILTGHSPSLLDIAAARCVVVKQVSDSPQMRQNTAISRYSSHTYPRTHQRLLELRYVAVERRYPCTAPRRGASPAERAALVPCRVLAIQ